MAMQPKLIINAAITGMMPAKTQTPYVPVTEDEIIRDALVCWRAGASIVHLHVRDEQGQPDYRAERYARIIRGIRQECDIIICVSTSGRTFSDFQQRAEVLHLQGMEKPEMASLTLGSFNFSEQASVNQPEMIVKLAETMLQHGIKPELEIFDTGMLNYAKYLDKKLQLPKPLYFNLLLGAIGGMQAGLEELAILVRGLPQQSFWAAAGIGACQLQMNTAAIIAGGGVRVGLEDNIYYDQAKTRLARNVELIQRIVHFALLYGREVATPDEARSMLNIYNYKNDIVDEVIAV